MTTTPRGLPAGRHSRVKILTPSTPSKLPSIAVFMGCSTRLIGDDEENGRVAVQIGLDAGGVDRVRGSVSPRRHEGRVARNGRLPVDRRALDTRGGRHIGVGDAQ